MKPWYETVVGVVVLDPKPKPKRLPRGSVNFDNLQVPRIRRFFPKLIKKELVSTQPMVESSHVYAPYVPVKYY